MNTNSRELYGLIGYPVKHSFSPYMHNAAFAFLKMDAEYRLFEVPPGKLDEFFKKTIVDQKVRGFNVTIPHKEAVVPYLNASVSQSVRMNQAVNTVRVETDGTMSGCNSDGMGFSLDLKERGFDVAGKKVSLLGAGGGAKAVATSIAVKHPAKLLIFDLDVTKAQALCNIVKNFFPGVPVEAAVSVERLEVYQADLLINATPVGMRESDPLAIKKEWLSGDLFVYDLIYNPAETKLLKAAKDAGCHTANGLGMLLYQGCLAFEYLTGRKAPVDVMRKALLERLHG
ncbi:MAG: shikimate dehydrogenase [Candidatus Omnitrophota bacterium]|mgnify:CR=1 FL=1